MCRSLKFTEGLENNNSSNSNGYNNNYNNNDSDSDSDDDDDSNGGFNFFSGPNTRRPGPRSAFDSRRYKSRSNSNTVMKIYMCLNPK